MTVTVGTAPATILSHAYATTSDSALAVTSFAIVEFDVREDMAYAANDRVRATSVATGYWMEGIVVNYSDSVLAVEVQMSFGAGTFSDWSINLAAEPGYVPVYPGAASGVSLVESHENSAATLAVRTLSGSVPSINNMGRALFNDGTLRQLFGALSLTIPQGVSLGTVENLAFRVWLLLIDDGGTLRLGAFQSRTIGNSIKCLPPNGVMPVARFGDGAGLVYVGVTITAPAQFIVLGCAEYDDGLPLAGDWTESPTRILLFGPGMRLPGAEVQMRETFWPTATFGSTIMPKDDTIPQVTEGDQYMSHYITPHSAMSVLEIQANACVWTSESYDNAVTLAVFKDGIVDALGAAWLRDTYRQVYVSVRTFAGNKNNQLYTVRMGKGAAGTGQPVLLNYGSSYDFGGNVCDTYMRITERQT